MKIQHETFFLQVNTPYEQDCLNCINRAYLIHVARLTNGIAHLRDDRSRLRKYCESLASLLQVKIIPYAQPRATRKCAYAQSIATTVL